MGIPRFSSSWRRRRSRAAIESAEEIYGQQPIVYPLDPASGPVGAVSGVQIPPTPVVSFGISYYGSNPHGPDENIRLEDFLRGVKYFGRIIHRLASLEDDAALARTGENVVHLNR